MYNHDFDLLAKAFARAKITGEAPILVLAEMLQNKYPKFNPEKFMDSYERFLHHYKHKEKNKLDSKGQPQPEENREMVTGAWVRGRNRKKVFLQR